MHIDFNSSEGCSLGVEWELMLVDSATGELANVSTEVLADLAAAAGVLEHPKAKHELFENTIEVITGICATAAEAHDDLAETVTALHEVAARRGLSLVCAGTHPFADWHFQQVSPDERYHRLVEEMQWLARRLLIFGVHVHVGVRGPEKAIAIANGLTAYIPHFLALSASSPFWRGHDTGLASARSKLFEALPTAGLPYQLSGWEEFEQFMAALVSVDAIASIREVWWDIRPHPDFGTVELRVCDGLPRLSDVIGLAALTQCLVRSMDDDYDAGKELHVPRPWIVRENKWRAARYGLDAELITDGKGGRVGLRSAIEELVTSLQPVAAALSCREELASVLSTVRGETSCDRQRRVAAASGDMVAVVRSLVEEFETDIGLAPARAVGGSR